jgi:hypothetical protein
VPQVERRRSARLRLQIPLFIRSTDLNGTIFLDLAKTLDISSTGALIASSRQLITDAPVQLTIPAPSPSSFSYSNLPPETPPIQGRVRRQESSGDVFLVGVEFSRPLE